MFWKKKKTDYEMNGFYSPIDEKNSHKEKKWVKSILIPGSKISFGERVVKLLIYFALRLVIRPKKWKNPEKNLRIINYTYRKIMSEDLIFIPSSLSFYIVMAFVPVLSIIVFFFSLDSVHNYLGESIQTVLGDFIPGIATLLTTIQESVDINNSLKAGEQFAVIALLAASIWISSAGFSKLIYTQSYLFDFVHRGSYLSNRLKGIMMVIGLTFFLGSALFLNVIFDKYMISNFSGGLKAFLKWTVNLIFLFLTLIIGFALLYWITPVYKIKFKNTLPGAFVTTIPTFLFFAMFSIITSLWSYDSYGAVGVIMYVGMSSIMISNFVFYGITVNSAYNREFVEEAIISKRGSRGIAM